MPPDDKSVGAFRTIGEVAAATGVAPHILRYWEGRFPQLRPVTRAGKRRYYRPEDVALVERIDRLLNREGYTIRGVQQLLSGDPRGAGVKPVEAAPGPPATPAPVSGVDPQAVLRVIRDHLQQALDNDV